MLFKNPYDILMEACPQCGSEECDHEELIEDEVEQELDEEMADVEEIDDEDLEYTEEMVNVIEQTTSEGSRYLVEMDVLAKYMKSTKIEDPAEALRRIAEHNELDIDTMHVVVESEEFVKELIEEAKSARKETKKIKLGKASSVNKLLKDLKNKGIKVLKKKKK